MRRRRGDIGPLVDLHPQVSVAIGGGGAGHRAVAADQRHGEAAAGDLDALGHFGDDADLGEFVVPARHEQDARVGAGIDRERHRHAGKDDGVIERNESERSHELTIRLLLDDVNYR